MNGRRVLLCAALAVLAAAPGPLRAVEFTREQASGKAVTVFRVDPRWEHLRLFLRDGAGQPFGRFDPLAAALLSADGVPRVVASPELPALAASVRLATQSGPLLVRAGKVHPAFRADSTSRLLRNGVGVDGHGGVVFAITEEPVNFHEFAVFFRDTLRCSDALFLDGSISSLYAPAIKRDDFRLPLGPIIGVVQP